MFRHRFQRRSAFAGLLLAWSLLAMAMPALAATVRCVGDSDQLAAALAQANAADADTQFLIKLRTGLYLGTGSSGFRVAPQRGGQTLRLAGGYADAACQSKTYGPARTILQGAGGPALEFTVGSNGLTGGQLYVLDLDLTNPDFGGAGGGACLRGNLHAGNAAAVERVATRDCRALWGTDASIWISNRGNLALRNVRTRSGTAASNGGIGITTSGSGLSRLAQISVTSTQSISGNAFVSGIRLSNENDAVADLSNSVVWGNDPDAGTADVLLYGPRIALTRVHYGTLLGTPAANLAPSTGDPGFVAASDPHLRADSILIDSGAADPEGGSGPFDLDGNLRVQGVAVDVGAHERPVPDAIFWNSFDFAD